MSEISSAQDLLVSCLNTHNITDFSTSHPPSAHFDNLYRFSVQNLRILKRSPKPYAIILPQSEEQLINAVLSCRRSSLDITIRCGGHSYEGLSSMPRGTNPFVIIDLKNLNRVIVDIQSETAWVEGGSTLGELYYAIAEKGGGYGFPAGIAPTVGVSGHFSGGGMGVMGRKYGLSADNVVDAILIDAEGRALNMVEMGPDVFWALRGGGGGNFGVVYKWKVRLVKVPEKVTCFRVSKHGPINELAQLIYKWQLVAPNLDDGCHLLASLTSSAKSEVCVTFIGFYSGSKVEIMSIKDNFFPELEMKEEEYMEMPWIESVLYFSGLPIGSTIQDLKSRYFVRKSCVKTKSDYVTKPISVKGLEGILEMVALEPKGRVMFDPYGGIMGRISNDSIAFPHRKGNLFNILYAASWEEEEEDVEYEKYLSWLTRVYEYMTPFVTSSPRAACVNYVDLDLGTNKVASCGNDDAVVTSAAWGRKYFLGNYERLVMAKTIIDPHNVFDHLQGIAPASVLISS